MRFVAVLALLLNGCAGYVRADAIAGPLERVVERHRAYVEGDDQLPDIDKRVWLRDGELLLRVVEESKGE